MMTPSKPLPGSKATLSVAAQRIQMPVALTSKEPGPASRNGPVILAVSP